MAGGWLVAESGETIASVATFFKTIRNREEKLLSRKGKK
jgi:hypothetical protein